MGDATVEAHYPTKFHHCSPHATFHRSRVRSVVRWHGDATVEACYTMKAPPFQPQATFHRPRVGSAERWHRECKGRDAILQRLHHCSHRPPSIDPGSGQWRGGTENAKAEMLYYKGSTIAASCLMVFQSNKLEH